MSTDIKYDRRHFLSDSARSIAMSQLAMIGLTNDQFSNVHAMDMTGTKQTIPPSFEKIKQIDAGVLNTGYVDDGPANGPVVILLHGWPYDIYSFADVAPILTKAGYRVIIPYLRGYGTTRFLSDKTVRNGQQSVVALDIISLMDALTINK